MLLLLHTRDTNNNKRQENTKNSNRNYHIQYIKYVQHKNLNTSWDYQNFPRHPVASEKFETRGINNILLHYHYRVDPELGKGVCDIFRITCACTSCVSKPDKDWLPTIPPPSQPRYSHVDFFTINKTWTLQWLDHHETIRQQDTPSWVWKYSCINYFRNVD